MKKQSYDNPEYSGLEELMNAEVMRNYNSFIVSLAMRYASNIKTAVDFGAGIGTLSLIFKDKFRIQPLCIEIDKTNREHLEKRGFDVVEGLSYIDDKVDLIFSSNVLEHIEDDLSVLRDMKNQLAESGKIFLYLPAKMSLWSKLDEEVGHYRRYEYVELKEKCEKVGLTIEKLHFADSIGFFASLAMKFLGYNKDGGIGSISSLQFYDKWLLPMSMFLDKVGCKYLFGKNIILVASKQHLMQKKEYKFD